jgi:hypothetical protein
MLRYCKVCKRPGRLVGVIKYLAEPYQVYNGMVVVCSDQCAEKYRKDYRENRPMKFFDYAGRDVDEYWEKLVESLNRVVIGDVVLDRRDGDFRTRYDQAVREHQAD